MNSQRLLDVSVNDAPDPIILHGDSEGLRRLFFILIDNAMKYTPDGGKIRVGLAKRESTAVFTVTDTGIGIGESDQPHIFDRFWRPDKVRSRERGGVGLGLSIARWIAEQHRGSIEVQSEPGRGSTFT